MARQTFPARTVGELRRLLNDSMIPDETPLTLKQQCVVGDDGALDTFIAPLARVIVNQRPAVTNITLEGSA